MKAPIINEFDRFILSHKDFEKSKFAKALRQKLKYLKTLKRIKKWLIYEK